MSINIKILVKSFFKYVNYNLNHLIKSDLQQEYQLKDYLLLKVVKFVHQVMIY